MTLYLGSLNEPDDHVFEYASPTASKTSQCFPYERRLLDEGRMPAVLEDAQRGVGNAGDKLLRAGQRRLRIVPASQQRSQPILGHGAQGRAMGIGEEQKRLAIADPVNGQAVVPREGRNHVRSLVDGSGDVTAQRLAAQDGMAAHHTPGRRRYRTRWE